MRGLRSRAQCRLIAAAIWLGFTGLLVVTQDQARAAPGDWTLAKAASPTTYTAAGQVITFTYTITNVRGQDGQIGFNGVPPGLTDDKATITDCPVGTPVP